LTIVNVLFITRSTLFTNRGGDTIQVTNTAEYLNRLETKTEIRLCNEQIDYAPYDLIHFFNIIRPADILHHIEASKKPYVVSPIFVDYEEYERKARKGMMSVIFRFFSADAIEYIKVLARSVVNREKIISRSYLWLGQHKSIRKIIGQAGMLLPNSENEYRRLLIRYKQPQKYSVVPNAIDPLVFASKQLKYEKEKNVVLCVARIEGRKNQLNLIKALNNTEFQLILIGRASTNQVEYYNECRRIAASNVSFIDHMGQEELIDFYDNAKVHVLPSWFETTGLSSLEAASRGCNIVVSDRGDTRDYFEEMAFYCDPSSPASIFEAVERAASHPFDDSLRKKILGQYTWPVAAQKTQEAYKTIISQ
jgi:glycosyltransferase involved in cell wall biosynthesis